MPKPSCPHCGGPTVLFASGQGDKAYRCVRADEARRAELLVLERQMRAINQRYEPHLRLIWIDKHTKPADNGPDTLFGVA